MPDFTASQAAVAAVAVLTLTGVLLRPRQWPEAVWAVAGAAVLLVTGLLPAAEALSAVARGEDVYAFLAGMMLLSELARRAGLFEYLAARCVQCAGGSASRLFDLLFGIGTLVTVFLSNDATAVVLTPAVLAVTRHARAAPPPYLMACALIANAASFVLPIANPANLVVFGANLPALGPWFARFALPSALSIVATWAVLRWLYRAELAGVIARDVAVPVLSRAGHLSGWGIAVTTGVLLCVSALGRPLGVPTLMGAGLVLAAVLLSEGRSPWPVLRTVSWSVLGLVAGLFVLVAALERVGVLAALSTWLLALSAASVPLAALVAGVAIALGCNLFNNLPTGLIAGSVVAEAGVDPLIQSAVAIGIDLGPNLSVTGSLATLLWLVAIRREGEQVSAWQFFKIGAVAMPVALLLALAGLLLSARWVG